jgi:hypothetical protein
MRTKRRGRPGVLTAAAVLVLSVLIASPARAYGAPPGWREVKIPPGTTLTQAAAPALALTKAAATAAPPGSCLGSTAAYGAGGCFVAYGDIVWAGDLRADGMSAAVGIYTDYGRPADVCVNKNGVNTWATCNKNYREDGNVRLQVWRYDSDTGKFYQPEAWSPWIPVDGQY